jgi:hypothetical protein
MLKFYRLEPLKNKLKGLFYGRCVQDTTKAQLEISFKTNIACFFMFFNSNFHPSKIL